MSRLYSAGQYNQEFQPRRLGNWEVSRWFPERRPRDPFQFKPTEIIVDDRGHFLPGVPKANRNPWNNHIGSHDLPPRISRAVATDIASRPPARLRYWDKPNTRSRGVPCASGPGASSGAVQAEGPGYPQHRNYFLAKQDYAAHQDHVEEQDAVAQEFLQERKRRQQADREHVEKVHELARTLRKQQEQQRQADAERDVEWLLKHRALHNVVPRANDWSRGSGRPGCDPMGMSLLERRARRLSRLGRSHGDSPRIVSARSSADDVSRTTRGAFAAKLSDRHQDDDEGIHEQEQPEPSESLEQLERGDTAHRHGRTSSWERGDEAEGEAVAEQPGCCEPQGQDDCKDSGVGSVDLQDPPDAPLPPLASPLQRPLQRPKTAYPQFEGSSGELLQRSNPAYPETDPAFSRRAACDPSIQGYPQPELLREPGYPEMFTTETDLATAADTRPDSPPPRPEPGPEHSGLPDPEAAALKCGRYPRRPPPARPYARAQFAVVAPDSPEPPRTRPTIPALATAYSSFQVAKQLHKENLEHNPLPDTIDDELFKKLNSQRHPHPGLALDVEPDAAAVGWRSFNAPGPTNCSKMRVYRPKTAGPVVAGRGKSSKERMRPSTGHPGKLLAKDHVSEMDLAICWDLVPKYPEDEPQPSPHIDGSNGSAAPGIFSLVHHPSAAEAEAEERRATAAHAPAPLRPRGNGCGSGSNCGSNCGSGSGSGGGSGGGPRGPRNTSTPPMGSKSSPLKPPSVESVHSSASTAGRQDTGTGYLHERLGALERQRAATNQQSNDRPGAHQQRVRDNPRDIPGPRAGDLFDRRLRGGCVGGDMAGCGDGTSRGDPRNLNDHLAELCKHKHHQSMPDLSQHRRRQARGAGHQGSGAGVGAGHGRPCAACHCDDQQPQLRRPKSEYKMAFKAGKPVTSLSTNSSFDSPSGSPGLAQINAAAREVRVPKQRAPFARKNYTISSLAQPFSLWPKETGHAYPEHWRLASVYQHSFKPVHSRSKPLLKTVYQ